MTRGLGRGDKHTQEVGGGGGGRTQREVGSRVERERARRAGGDEDV